MSAAVDTTEYRADIDGLRGIAVLTVVGFHAFPGLFPGGFVGVDIFFVISGFLISGILFKSHEAGTFSYLDFYSRRIKRIFPALIVVLLATWAIGWFVLLADEYKNLGKHIVGGGAFISNFILWNESGYFDVEAQLKPLLHLWSLGVEEQFYILWPVLLLIVWRRRLDLLAAIALLGVLSFAANVIQVGTSPVSAFYFPTSRMWELMLGALLAYGESKRQRWGFAFRRSNSTREAAVLNLASACGLALILASVACLNKSLSYPGYWALMPTLGAFLMMAAGSDAWVNRKVLASRALVLVGLISYPLYLWHWPLLSFADNLYALNTPYKIRLAAIALAVIMAWLTYALLEKPIRFGRFKKFKRSAPAVLAMSMAGVVALGSATYVSGGFPNRFPKELKNIVDYDFDYRGAYRGFRCLLGPEQSESAFAADCVDPAGPSRPTSLFLWGDSHAGALFPGFKSFQESRGFSVGQLTTSSCPPLLDYDSESNRNCRSINEFVAKKIAESKPKIVVLHASWGAYGESANRTGLAKTVAFLRKAGVEKIEIVGPVPIWNPSLPKAVIEAYRKDWPHQLHSRLTNAARTAVEQTDKEMRKIASANSIAYYSAFDLLCGPDDCLALLEGEPIAWDSAHLTAAGSHYLVGQIIDRLLQP